MNFLIISLPTLYVVSFAKTLPFPPIENCDCIDPITKICSYLAPCPKMDYCDADGVLCPSYPKAKCKFTGCGGCRTYFVDEFNQVIEDCNADICSLPPQTGLCRAYFPRYYFNEETQQCERFIYGGCGGNANNFQRLEECENACNINICSLPSETGPCRAAFPRYFYNDKTQKCDRFIYGGCGGNDNNFKTLSECEQTCPKKSIIPIPNCGKVLCAAPDCAPGEYFVPKGECCPVCPQPPLPDIDCGKVLCLKPQCKPGVELYTAKGECCPKCGLDCRVVLCLEAKCGPNEELYTAKGGCCAQCRPKPCEKKVLCLIEPCKYSSCDNFPDAVCENNYCNECKAIWRDANGNDISNKCVDKPDCVPQGWSYIGDSGQCAAIRFICGEGYESWFSECGCGCKPKDIIVEAKCETGGCSGQICAENAKGLISTCEWKCEYGCTIQYQTCGNGIIGTDKCAWFFENDASKENYYKCVEECGGALLK